TSRPPRSIARPPPSHDFIDRRRCHSELLRRLFEGRACAVVYTNVTAAGGAIMRSKRHPQVVNVDEVESIGRIKGRFGATAKRLAAPAGASKIGCNWMELQPGKTSFPYHYHTGIEEGLFILAGSGELRIGKDTVAVGQGDYVAFPAGPDYAHALTNTGSQPLQYLVF